MDEPVIRDEPAADAPAPEPVAEESTTSDTRPRWPLALKAIALMLVVALLALLSWATLAAGKGKGVVAKISAGEKPAAPAFTLDVLWIRSETWPPSTRPALADGKLSLAELRGRPVVINFWASWCIPCREEAPILGRSAPAHRGEVVFLGIDVQDLRGDALAFLREFDVPYVSVRDRSDDVYRDYGLTGVPETYYVDSRGRIVAHTPGPVTRETLEAGITAVIRG